MMKQRLRRHAPAMLVLALVAGAAAANLMGKPVRVDSGVFLTVATHMSERRALYTEVWDHKPALIYLINRLALATGGGLAALRAIEGLFLAAAALALYLLLWRQLRHRGLALAGGLALLMALTHPRVLQGGNLTEEYGAALTMVGIALTLTATPGRGGRALLRAGGGGACLALAAWAKEPFLLGAPPWGIYLLADAGWRRGGRLLGAWLGGGLAATLAMLGWLAAGGALGGALDLIFFNNAYAAATRHYFSLAQMLERQLYPWTMNLILPNLLMTSGCVLGLGAAFLQRPGRRRLTARVALAALALGVLGTALATNQYGHYYLQPIPAAACLAATGWVWAARGLRRVGPRGRRVAGWLLVLLLVLETSNLARFALRIHPWPPRPEPDPFTLYLRRETQPGDLLWTLSTRDTRYLWLCDLRSPVPRLYARDIVLLTTPAGTGEEKGRQLAEGLQAHPPRFIIVPPERGRMKARHFLEQTRLMDWIAQHYEPVGPPGPRGERLHRLRNGGKPRTNENPGGAEGPRRGEK